MTKLTTARARALAVVPTICSARITPNHNYLFHWLHISLKLTQNIFCNSLLENDSFFFPEQFIQTFQHPLVCPFTNLCQLILLDWQNPNPDSIWSTINQCNQSIWNIVFTSPSVWWPFHRPMSLCSNLSHFLITADVYEEISPWSSVKGLIPALWLVQGSI